MLLFSRLRFGAKLTLLAGIPILGILLLSVLVVRDMQQRAQAAAGLGSLEDLARLSQRILEVIDELQWERAIVSRDAGRGGTASAEAKERQQKTDAALTALQGFLGQRDEASLPTKLRQDLAEAREHLRELPAVRARAQDPRFDLLEFLGFFAEATDSLTRASAALTQLSDDKQLLSSLGVLVSALQVIERNSREHALLNYVLAKKEFPPGSFRYLITLITEQEVYTESLRTWASEEEFARQKVALRGPLAEQIAAMRRTAIETTEDTPGVDPQVWSDAQDANMRALVRMEHETAEAVQVVVSAKVASVQRAVRIAGGLVAAVVLASVLIGIGVARSLTRSVRVLAAAAVAVQKKNDFSVRAEKTSSDELGVLTDAFNLMLAGIQQREQELDGYRRNLESLVEARTSQLVQRNDEMRLVLDNIDQGLATIDPEGKLLGECSKNFEQAFGAPGPGTSFFEFLAPGDSELSFHLQAAYEQLMADVLPIELALDQMPRQLVRDGRHYALAFKSVLQSGRLSGALLVTRDETLELENRRLEAEQRERVRIFERVMRDPEGLREALREAERLLAAVKALNVADDLDGMRALHTLKGVAAVSDITSVAQAAHALEQALLSTPERVELERRQLLERWAAFSAFAEPVLGSESVRRVHMTPEDLEEIIENVRASASHASLLQMLLRSSRQPVKQRLDRLGEQLVALARRLGKPEPRVVIDASQLRLPPDALRAFWSSLPHLVRNIVDHGLQSVEDRTRQGKPPTNCVQLRAWTERGQLKLEISDDGRGIDWQRLAQKAEERGLASDSHAALVEALFADGVSTAETVSETSGRGIGMSAVRAACVSLGGAIAVESEPGRGTFLRFEFPLGELDAQVDSETRPTQPRPTAVGLS
jgi:two-component system, chemotaxis family, sensor kinase CheA